MDNPCFSFFQRVRGYLGMKHFPTAKIKHNCSILCREQGYELVFQSDESVFCYHNVSHGIILPFRTRTCTCLKFISKWWKWNILLFYFRNHETRLKIQSLSLQVVQKSIIWIVNWLVLLQSREKYLLSYLYLRFVLYKHFKIMTRITFSL